jgi:hypothetical protein
MRKEQKLTTSCFDPATFHPGRPFAFASVALLCTLALVAFADAQAEKPDQPTRSAEATGPEAMTIAQFLPQSVVMTNPPAGLPQQGPWEFSVGDLKWPMETVINLVPSTERPSYYLHYNWLWEHLSKETQTLLIAKYAELHKTNIAIYHPGPELGALVGDLNVLVRTNPLPLLPANFLSGVQISGDTLTLLERTPSGTNSARLNRLLLEDKYPRDFFRQPKVLMEPDSKALLFYNFKAKSLSLYTETGRRLWSSDLSATIRDTSDGLTPFPDITGVQFDQDKIIVWVGKLRIILDRKSGRIVSWARL